MQTRPEQFGRIALVAATLLLCGGLAVEFGIRVALANRHSAWLLRPVLYIALPKPGFREHPFALALELVSIPFALWFMWFLRAVPTKRLLALRIGVGLLLGGAIGLFVSSVAFDASANLFVAQLGDWGYAFSPFDGPMVVGLALVIGTLATSSLDDEFRGLRWRDLLVPRSHR
jgi:hypothetical protein